MVSLKRKLYGLPALGWYRSMRSRQFARAVRPTQFGFSIATSELAFDPSWECHEREALISLVPNCSLFVDVGANHGFYTLLAHSFGVPAIAVEPERGNLEILRQNLAANGCSAEVCPVALSDTEGEAAFYGDGDMASLVRTWQGVPGYFHQRVKVTTLDKLLEGRSGQILIKVDVEGAEDAVLRGSHETLSKTPKPYWIIESFTDLPTGGASPAFQPLFEIMFDAGYSAISLGDNQQELTPSIVRGWRSDPLGGSNFLFVDANQRPV